MRTVGSRGWQGANSRVAKVYRRAANRSERFAIDSGLLPRLTERRLLERLARNETRPSLDDD